MSWPSENAVVRHRPPGGSVPLHGARWLANRLPHHGAAESSTVTSSPFVYSLSGRSWIPRQKLNASLSARTLSRHGGTTRGGGEGDVGSVGCCAATGPVAIATTVAMAQR